MLSNRQCWPGRGVKRALWCWFGVLLFAATPFGAVRAADKNMALAQPVAPDGSVRRQIEADWAQQDACRLRQISEPGLVRFPGEELNWPGAKADERLRVPVATGPKLDGRLDDACWQAAAQIAGDAPVTTTSPSEGPPAWMSPPMSCT